MMMHYFTILCGLTVLIYTCLLAGVNCFSHETPALCMILNMENKGLLPRNFRMTEAPYTPEIFHHPLSMVESPCNHGLAKLCVSGSGQFSEQSLDKILSTIPAKKILLLDLREESHGFINGIAVSWYSDKDWSNKDKSLEEILADEKQRLQKALKEKNIYLFEKAFFPENPHLIQVQEVYTEAELAKRMGIPYVRIPVTDHLKPSVEVVDQIIHLIKNQLIDQKIWIHSHCSAGRGRTTTFICMYDMMLNASKVSFEDILLRQALIGGKDLTEPFDIYDWRYEHHFERLQFLKDFYMYCQENPNFEQYWSSWIKIIK
jgi:protein-tyrosine phosphatase